MSQKKDEHKPGLKRGALNLAEAGLILVAIPLIFQICLTFALSQALTKIETQTLALLHSKSIISAASQVTVQFYTVAMGLSGWRFDHDPSIPRNYLKSTRTAHESIEQLVALTKGNPDQTERVRKIGKLGLEADSVVAQYAHPLEVGTTPNLEKTQFRLSLTQTVLPMAKELQILMKQEEAKLRDKNPDPNSLLGIIFIGLMANLFLSGALGLFFSNSILSRIHALTNNLKRCAERKELAPNLEGRDELVHLDEVFHRLDDSLTAVEKRKREFVAMINHDLRTPLTTLQYILALAQKGSYGEFSEAEKNTLAQQEGELSKLVDYVNEFLADEKKKTNETGSLIGTSGSEGGA